MELNINDFRDWLYDRIEEDDGVVVVDTVQFNEWGYRGYACPLHEYILDSTSETWSCDTDSLDQYATDDDNEVRPPQWARDFMDATDEKHPLERPSRIPDAYDCLAILDEIEVGRRGKQRKA